MKTISDWIRREKSIYNGGGYTACPHCKTKYSWGAYPDADSFFLFCPRCGERNVRTEEADET